MKINFSIMPEGALRAKLEDLSRKIQARISSRVLSVPAGARMIVRDIYDEEGKVIGQSYQFRVGNRDVLYITPELVKIDEVKHQRVREIWVAFFDADGNKARTEGWLADVGPEGNVLIGLPD